METRKMETRKILLDARMTRRFRQAVLALGAAALGTAFVGPAGAQLAGSRAAFDQRERPELVQFNDFFQPFWGGGNRYRNRGYDPYNPFTQRQQQPQSYEALKPPAPKKVDTPPSETVLVIGDQNADWLAYGLEEALSDTPQVGVVRRIKPYAGLIRYEPRADSPDWSQALKEVLAAEKPSAIVVMLGLNDRIPLRERLPPPKPATPAAGQGGANTTPGTPAEGGATTPEQPAAAGAEVARKQTPPPAPPAPIYGPSYEFHNDKWGELYEKRIDEMMAVLKSKGVPVIWVGLPSIRGAKSTSDMSYLDELYRARAEKAGIIYADIWDGFVDEQGHYTQQGPDFEGQIRRLRTYDGVNFTKYGAEKLAHYVEHELRRLLTSHVMPVALPGPEEQAPAAKGTTDAKPAPGPVVPLNAAGKEGGELLGAANHAAPKKEPDPLATRVLGRGEALAAPHGRADDFSWPRADISSGGASAPQPAPSPPPPGSSGKTETNKTETNKSEGSKADANKAEANKGDANKAEAKKPAAVPAPGGAGGAPAAAPNAAPARPRQTNQDLDGGPPPRPPAPVGPAAAR
jgi:uncharacterized protein